VQADSVNSVSQQGNKGSNVPHYERQQILRLVVKEVLVDGDTITLRHSIPIPPTDAGAHGLPPASAGPPRAEPDPDYLLRSRRHEPPMVQA
jgi:site-specific DNA recombinase